MLNALTDSKSNTGYALTGIRRVGKTSILRELESRLGSRKNVVVIYLSLWELVPLNIETFLEQLIILILDKYKKHLSLHQKITELMKTPASILKQLLKRLDISIKLKEDIGFVLGFKQNSSIDYNELYKKTFSMSEKLAQETNTKCILMLDEFPAMLDVKHGIDFIRALRTIHETQKRTVLCIAGSSRKTMDAAVLSSTSPFYKQFIVKEIKPLQKEDIAKILSVNFKEYGISYNKEIIGGLYNAAKGIPFYIQFIGKLITARGVKFVDMKVLDNVIKAFLEEEGNTIFMDYFHYFSSKEQKLLSAVANDYITVSQISKEAGEPPNKVSTYLLYLMDKGAIKRIERGKYAFVDNMFKEWLRLRMMKTRY